MGEGGSWPLRATSTRHTEEHRKSTGLANVQAPQTATSPSGNAAPGGGSLGAPEVDEAARSGAPDLFTCPTGNPSPAGGRGAPGGRDVQEGSLLGQGREESSVVPLRPPPPPS